jgi:zinc protease
MTPSRPGAPGDAVVRTVLPNGLTVLVRRDPSAPVVAIVTHVKAGYFDEPDRVSGVAHVLEHMYFKGTPTRGPGVIARDTKAVGGYLNAGTIYDYTMYYAVLPASGFVAGLDVQADAYAHSLIDADELAREIEVIVEEERRKQDTPTAVATEGCYALLHDVHRMRRWRIGHPAALRTFTRDDVAGFYRAHYVPSNTVLSIVGDVDPEVALREVIARYGGLPAGEAPRDRGPAEPPHGGFRWHHEARDVAQTQLVLGWRTVPPTHADAPALDVAAALLGAGRASRLYREVRERTLASTVGAYHYAPTELGVAIAHAEAPPERAADAVLAMWSQVRALGAEAPSRGELARVHRGLEARWWRRLESMEGQATYLAAWEALGGWERGATALEAQLSVTPAAVQDVARRYLGLDQLALVSLRPLAAPPLADSADALRDRLAAVPSAPPVARGGAPVGAPALLGLGVAAEARVAGVHVFRTDGGLPVLVRPKPGAPITHVQAVFRGGVTGETEADAGRTALMVRTALQGSAARTSAQLAEDLEGVGGAVGHAVGLDAFGWHVSAPTDALPAALALLADAIETPAFAGEALETERGITLAALAQLGDDMMRQPMQLALGAAFAGHAYGRPTLGREAAVRAMATGALRRAHERLVRSGAAALVVVGDVGPDEAAALVRGAFRRLAWADASAVAAPHWPAEPADIVEEWRKAQTALAMLLPAPGREDPDRHAAAVLATVASGLGGRFFAALRDRESLAYTVHVGARAARGAGWFTSYLACAPGKEAQARAGLVREWALLADAAVDPEELARAKAYLLGALAIRQQSAASVASDVAEAWSAGALESLVEEPEAIRAVTAADLRRVAERALAAAPVWGAVRGRAD